MTEISQHTTSASHTSITGAPFLISAKALAAVVDEVVLLDVRWTLDGPDEDSYRAGHIPGAIFVDLDQELAAPPGDGGRHPLPSVDVINGLLRRAGIHPDSQIVVYGENDARVAARAWWLLRWAGIERVQVLNGGFAAWVASGLEIDTIPHSGPDNGTAVAHIGQLPTADADAVAQLAAGRGLLIDVRAAERYRGEIEPIDPRPGHIPGAINLPLDRVFQRNGRFLPPADLARVVDKVAVGPDADIAVSCGSGVNASAFVLAGAVVGRQLSLYPGSYSGWCADGRDVVREAEGQAS